MVRGRDGLVGMVGVGNVGWGKDGVGSSSRKTLETYFCWCTLQFIHLQLENEIDITS